MPDNAQRPARPFVFRLSGEQCVPSVVAELKEIFAHHAGTAEVHIHVYSGDRTVRMRLADEWRVSPSASLVGDLLGLLGRGCLDG